MKNLNSPGGGKDRPGRSRTGRFGQLSARLAGGLLRVVAVTMLAALIAMVNLAPARAATNNPTTGNFGSARFSQRVTPRIVKPHKMPPSRSPHKVAHVRGGVPKAPGQATVNRPPVVSDMPPATKGKAGAAQSAASPSQATGNGNFENLLAFTGATSDTDGCGCEPPDTQMAVGNNQVFEPVNTSAFVYDRSGKSLGTFALTDLFQPPNQSVQLSDPKVLFDPTAGSNGRYYLTMMVCQNAACNGNWTDMGDSIAVSQSDDPLGKWTVYDYIRDTKNLLDQEKLGFSGDKVTFAVNEYTGTCSSGTCFKQENVVVLQKSDLVNSLTTTSVVDTATITSSTFAFDWIPTTPVNASTSDNTQFLVWNNSSSSNNTMGVMRITGTPAGANVDFSNVQTPAIGNTTSPPAGVQPGTCFDQFGNTIACTVGVDKTNFQSAMVQGNDLWATGTDGCTPQNDNTLRACTRLVEVNLSNGGSNIVYDTDVGTQGTYRYNPSVMKDDSGHMFFGFTISSSSLYPTAAVDASSLPPPAVFPRINYASGDATYTGSRWGDYSGLAQDPKDTGDVWAAQEFGACTTVCKSNNSGNWATALGQFTFDNPHIFAVSPNHGPATGGTTVDIFGADFANGVNSGTSVNFGSTPAQSVTWIDAGHIQAVSPASGSGTVDITATTLDGTSEITSNDQFTFNPVVSSVIPNAGPTAGGQTVKISGAGFSGATAVNFGGTPASSFSVSNGGLIIAVTPAEAAGTVDVIVTSNGQTSQTSLSDNYTFFNPPSLTSVSPKNGPAAGGQSVTITGANLTGATSVSFGGTAASSFTVVNSTTITATTPAHSGGTVNLTVTTPGGTSNAVAYTFMFPTTTSLASSANPSIVGQSVTYTATVSPVPDGGTVAFSDNGSPIAACQQQPVNTATGQATCTVTYNVVGSHSLIATYSGDFNYAGSTSAVLIQKVAYAVKALYSQTKDNNSGAVVVIKVELDNAAGSNVSSSSIVLTVTGLSPSPAPGTPPSGTFTFMTLDTGPGYQLNIKTTGYPSGTYTLSFKATGDPTTHTVQFVIG